MHTRMRCRGIRIPKILAVAIVLLILWSVLWTCTAARIPLAGLDLQDHRGNFAMLVLEEWQPVRDSYYSSVEEDLHSQSLFQTASISKWVTSIGVLKLISDGRIGLDAPVLHLIPKKFLPESTKPASFQATDITPRMLMNHTAGLIDSLGYLGFALGEETQTLRESLLYAEDAKEGASAVIRIGRRPGSQWQYSGGGFALLELLIESLSDEDFDSYMRREILHPLGMQNASFRHPEQSLALHFDTHVSIHPHRTFAAASTSGLYASISDLAAFVESLQPGGALEQLIGKELRREMMQNQASIGGLKAYGLGIMQYRPLSSRDPVIGHDGNNWPGISTTVRIRPKKGAGIIVLSSGDPELASSIASAWQQKETGWLDSLGLLKRISSPLFVLLFGLSYLLLCVLALALVAHRLARESSRV